MESFVSCTWPSRSLGSASLPTRMRRSIASTRSRTYADLVQRCRERSAPDPVEDRVRRADEVITTMPGYNAVFHIPGESTDG